MGITQEEKQLLLKDICARLSYGVKVKCPHWDYERDDDFITIETLIGIDEKFLKTKDEKGNIDIHTYTAPLSPLKPYLRPMSSMTEEEGNEYFNFRNQELQRVAFAEIGRESAIAEITDWLNARHFDYRGLIEKGLALEAPEGMYK